MAAAVGSAFLIGAFRTMSAASADVVRSAKAAMVVAMVFVIVMTSPAHAVSGPKMLWT